LVVVFLAAGFLVAAFLAGFFVAILVAPHCRAFVVMRYLPGKHPNRQDADGRQDMLLCQVNQPCSPCIVDAQKPLLLLNQLDSNAFIILR
jgi:hypothetical protein